MTCDNMPRNRSKLSHLIELHENWYPNSIEQTYQFNQVCCNLRKYKIW